VEFGAGPREEEGFEPVVDVGAAFGVLPIPERVVAGDVRGKFEGQGGDGGFGGGVVEAEADVGLGAGFEGAFARGERVEVGPV
jgi:hypothetical protein